MSTQPDGKLPEYHVEVDEQHNVQALHAPIMREQAEPRDGFEPIPPFMAPLFGALIFWAGFYFASHFGDFSPSRLAQDPERSGAEGPEKPLTLVEKGAKIFAGTCASCHGTDGAGVTCPPLAGSEWINERSAGVVVRILLNGVEGPIEVKGKSYTLSMKLADPLSDDDAAAVATYVRQAWGNKPHQAGDITPAYVAAARKKIAGRTTQWTAAELKALPDSYLDLHLGANAPPGEGAKDTPPEKK
jgi:mono/diheme cytochrome c family protein